jgi:EAL domain-containing protein (putative c-di-GMP-specific phosphodiesterase class I)
LEFSTFAAWADEGDFPCGLWETFVRDLETVENTAIVRAALGLARALGIEMIVEGVETLAQLELLRSLGCEYVQGYYFSKPLSVSDATSLLRVGEICKSRDTI